MHAVAQQIIAAGPELVSVQELDQWFTGPIDPTTGKCGPVTIEFDMMRELLDALAAQGALYEVAVQAQQLAVPPLPGFFPPSTCVQVINRVRSWRGPTWTRILRLPPLSPVISRTLLYYRARWDLCLIPGPGSRSMRCFMERRSG